MSLLNFFNTYDFLFIYLISILFIVFMYQLFYIEDPYDNTTYINCYENFESNQKGIYTAIIVEPREHKALEMVLNNFLELLSDEWNIVLCHGNLNYNFCIKIINRMPLEYRQRISLVDLKVDNIKWEEYSQLLVKKEFYDNIPTEVFLIFQSDTIICKDYKDKINKFIKYDYVGAPWASHAPLTQEFIHTVGNGGLSLRRKSKMLEIIDKLEYKGEPEDQFFVRGCKLYNCNNPSFEEAKEFSVETEMYEAPFGIHKPWPWIAHDKYKLLASKCPGLEELENKM
jgi:hypothetical protein